MRFKIDWARFIVERKFTVFALLYFVFEGNFPRGACIWRADLTGFFALRFWGLLFGGAYALFSELYGINEYRDKCIYPSFTIFIEIRSVTFTS